MSIIKKMSIISAIITLFCAININAAIVSDNDGSAFVTKSEFEAMKKSFTEQISQYESSITGKIDGAIASYLAGIQVAKTQELTNYLKQIYDDDDKSTTFLNNTSSTVFTTGNTTLAYGGLFDLDIFAGWTNITGRTTDITPHAGTVTFWRYNNLKAPSGGLTEVPNHKVSTTDNNEKKLNTDWKWIAKRATYSNIGYCSIQNNYRTCDVHHLAENRCYLTTSQRSSNYTEPAVGLTWTIDLSAYRKNQADTQTITSDSTGNSATQATRYHVYTEDEDTTNTSDIVRYLPGTTVASTTLYCLDKDTIAKFDDPTLVSEDIQGGSDLTNENSPGGRTNTYSTDTTRNTGNVTYTSNNTNAAYKKDFKFVFKYYHQTYHKTQLDKLISLKASSMLDRAVFRYEGIPFTATSNSGKITVRFTLDKKSVIGIKKGGFTNAAIPDATATDMLYKATLDAGTHKISFDYEQSNSDTNYIFVKACPVTDGELCTVNISGTITQVVENT